MSKTATTRTAKPAASKGGVSPFVAAMTVSAKAEGDGEGDGDDDEKRKRKDGESDADYEARMKALDDSEKPEAADDSEKPDAAAPDDDKAKAARAEGHAAGVAAERARWETTLTAPEAAGKGSLACEFLAGSDMTAARIVVALGRQEAPRAAGGLAARMQANQVVPPAPGDGGTSLTPGADGKITASMISAAAAKARGEAPRA